MNRLGVSIGLLISMLLLPVSGKAGSPEKSGTSSSFHRMTRFSLEIDGSYVLPTVRKREDQFFSFLSVRYEFLSWKRHDFGAFLRPLYYHDPHDDILGVSTGLSDRIWENPRTRSGYYLLWEIGGIYTNELFQGNGAHYNFYSGLFVGYHPEHRRWFIHVGGQHISNGYLKKDNVGINALSFMTGFFL